MPEKLLLKGRHWNQLKLRRKPSRKAPEKIQLSDDQWEELVKIQIPECYNKRLVEQYIKEAYRQHKEGQIGIFIPPNDLEKVNECLRSANVKFFFSCIHAPAVGSNERMCWFFVA